MKDDIAVWQKPLDNSCYEERAEDVYPPVCDDAIEADAAWWANVFSQINFYFVDRLTGSRTFVKAVIVSAGYFTSSSPLFHKYMDW